MGLLLGLLIIILVVRWYIRTTLENRIITLFLLGFVVTEIHGFIYFMWPETYNITYDLFWSKDYNEKLSVLWYVHELSGILNKIIWAYAVAKMGTLVSTKLFYIGIVFFCFYVVGFFFYMWDRNTSFLRNYLIYTVMANLIITICIPEKKQGIYRQMG